MGHFAKFRKATIIFAMSVGPSSSPSQPPYWTHLFGFWYSKFLRKSTEKIKVLLKYDKINVYFHENHCTFIISWQIFLEWKFFWQMCRKIKTHFMFSKLFLSQKPCRLRVNSENYCTARQDTDDNMGHAHCILDT